MSRRITAGYNADDNMINERFYHDFLNIPSLNNFTAGNLLIIYTLIRIFLFYLLLFRVGQVEDTTSFKGGVYA
jgi:hypothetical protein